MREKLKSYVELLFAGTTGTEEMQQEILQNTLDRYDDLIAQGKTPEEAYRQAVAGIGDIEALLGNQQEPASFDADPQAAYVSMGRRICDAVAVALYILSPIPLFLFQNALGLCCLLGMVAVGVAIQVMAGRMMDTLDERDPLSAGTRSIINAAAIALYILCPVPLFLFQNELGLCCLLGMVACGVAMQIVAKKGQKEGVAGKEDSAKKQEDPVRKNLSSLLWLVGTAVYLLVSFRTGAWWITWILFPITGTIVKLLFSILDLCSGRSADKNVSRLVVQGTVIVVILCVLFGSLKFGNVIRTRNIFTIGDSGDSSADSIQAESGQFDADTIRKLNIDWVSGSVTLRQADVRQITYSVEGDSKDATVFRQDGDKLTISYQEGSVFWFGAAHSKDLTVLVPKDWSAENVNIEVVSAPMQVEGLRADTLALHTTSGRIEATGLEADTLSVESVSGRVTLSGAAEKLTVDTVSGECTASLTGDPREIRMESVSANLRLELPASLGFETSLDSVSGKLKTDLELTLVKNGNYRWGDGTCQIQAETVSGNLYLN